MFATWDLAAEQSRENLVMGETSIDVEGAIANAVLAAQFFATYPGLVLLQDASDTLR